MFLEKHGVIGLSENINSSFFDTPVSFTNSVNKYLEGMENKYTIDVSRYNDEVTKNKLSLFNSIMSKKICYCFSLTISSYGWCSISYSRKNLKASKKWFSYYLFVLKRKEVSKEYLQDDKSRKWMT